jgi:putative sigma-54 modulation protein
MTIEIHSPNLKVSEKVLDVIKKKVLTLSHFSEKVSRAEIFLTEDHSLASENKVCKIRLDIFGDTLFVHKNAGDFEKAAVSAVRILKRRLKKIEEERNEPPEKITSTVKV